MRFLGKPLVIALSVVLLAVLIPGISQSGSSQDASANGIILSYDEQEAGVDAYPLRILVVPGYLRMDDGDDHGDFMLFDRVRRTIYSVNHEDRDILVIGHNAAADEQGVQPDLNLGVEKIKAVNVPPVDGKKPDIYRFTAAGEVCIEAVVVPGLLPAAVQALGEYGRLLAEHQRSTLENTPVEFRTPCYLSRYVYMPGRQLLKGLPIQEWDNSGYRRTLIDFQGSVLIDPALFELPAGYSRYTPGG